MKSKLIIALFFLLTKNYLTAQNNTTLSNDEYYTVGEFKNNSKITKEELLKNSVLSATEKGKKYIIKEVSITISMNGKFATATLKNKKFSEPLKKYFQSLRSNDRLTFEYTLIGEDKIIFKPQPYILTIK